MCRRLEIDEQKFTISFPDLNSSMMEESSDIPTVAALKFLIIPVIAKDFIPPKVILGLLIPDLNVFNTMYEKLLVFSLGSLSVLLDKAVDFKGLLSTDDPDSDPRQDVTRMCLEILEAVRFEKVRSTFGGKSSVEIKLVVSGVPNTFDILDPEDGFAEDIFLQTVDTTVPSVPSDDGPNDIELDQAAISIQRRWKIYFEYLESCREHQMQLSLANSVIKVC